MQSTISTISGIAESFSTFMINGIYKNPPFSISNKIPIFGHKYVKLAAVVAIHLGLLFHILRMFKPRNTKEMYSIYVVCFWILLMTVSIVVVNPYDEDSIEYMLSKEDIEKLKRIAQENIIDTPVAPKPEDLPILSILPIDSDTPLVLNTDANNVSETSATSFPTVALALLAAAAVTALKIYTFLSPLPV
jgi:hypothetical protein